MNDLRNTLSWEAKEYIHVEKKPDWFWSVAIISIGVAIASFLFHNILFGIFSLLAGFTISLFAAKQPETVSFSISPRGIQAGSTLYPYSALKSFWVIHDGPEPKILLQSKKTLVPQIILPLGDANTGDIQSLLQTYLREEEQYEPLPHKIMDKLGY